MLLLKVLIINLLFLGKSSLALPPKKLRNIFYWDVLIDILATYKRIEKNVCDHSNDNPVRCDRTSSLGNCILDERHYATTYYHHHKDT